MKLGPQSNHTVHMWSISAANERTILNKFRPDATQPSALIGIISSYHHSNANNNNNIIDIYFYIYLYKFVWPQKLNWIALQWYCWCWCCCGGGGGVFRECVWCPRKKKLRLRFHNRMVLPIWCFNDKYI